MSYHYHTIVDPQATADSADALASRVLSWLVREQIVEGQKTDCLFKTEGGYAPASLFRDAIKPIREQYVDWFLAGKMKGLDVVTKRTVFHAGGNPIELACDNCSRRYDAPPSWGDAVGRWYEGDDDATLACPFCDQRQPVTKWKHVPTYGFGFLGFEFLNWPDLKDSFINQMAECLGHRIILVSGHM